MVKNCQPIVWILLFYHGNWQNFDENLSVVSSRKSGRKCSLFRRRFSLMLHSSSVAEIATVEITSCRNCRNLMLQSSSVAEITTV
jgi:hypothetical protein